MGCIFKGHFKVDVEDQISNIFESVPMGRWDSSSSFKTQGREDNHRDCPCDPSQNTGMGGQSERIGLAAQRG